MPINWGEAPATPTPAVGPIESAIASAKMYIQDYGPGHTAHTYSDQRCQSLGIGSSLWGPVWDTALTQLGLQPSSPPSPFGHQAPTEILNTYNPGDPMAITPKDTKDRPEFLETTFKKYFGGRRIKACKGEIGLEIEAEGKNLFNSPLQYWTAVSDGSLRNYEGHPPLEYVLREPIKREEVGDALKYLADRLKAAKSELHMSHRCSVHVHVNAQQMTMKNLINYMCLYFIFEDMLVHWASPERKGNLFCLRAKDAEYQIKLLKDSIKSGDFSGVFEKEYRYSAMNFSALGEHGSLEFRAMKGTVDINTISNWVSMLLAMKDAAETFKNPETISRMFQSLGPAMFFDKVFKDKLPAGLRAELKSTPDFHKVLWDAFRVMRDVCHAVDWTDPPKWMVGVTTPTAVMKKKPAVTLVASNEDEW